MINSLASLKKLVVNDCEVTQLITTDFACPKLAELQVDSTDIETLNVRCPMLRVLRVHDIDFLHLIDCNALCRLETSVDCVEGGESVTHLICQRWVVSENHVSGRFPNLVDLSLESCCSFHDGDVITLDDLPCLKNLTIDDGFVSQYVIKRCPLLNNINITHHHTDLTPVVLHDPDGHHIVWTPNEV